MSGRSSKKFDMEKLLNAISIKTGEYADIAGIKLKMHILNKQRNDALISLGKLVYNMYKKDSFNKSRLEDKCREIAELDDRLKSKEKDIERIHESAGKIMEKSCYRKKRKHRVENETKSIIQVEDYNIEPAD